MITFRVESDLTAFAAVAGPFLRADEVAHNLLLGLFGDLADPRVSVFAGNPVLGVVEGEAGVEGVCVMIPPRNLVVSRSASAGALDAMARGLAVRQVRLPGVGGPAAEARVFASAWQVRALQRAHLVRRMQLCEARAVSGPDVPPPGSPRPAGPGDAELVAEWIAAFNQEALEEAADHRQARRIADHLVEGPRRTLTIWEDGVPVSMAATGGRTETGARVFAVYTPPAHRRRGYASGVVASVTREVLTSGRRYACLYYDLANPTAGHIYQQLGYRPVGTYDEYRFGV